MHPLPQSLNFDNVKISIEKIQNPRTTTEIQTLGRLPTTQAILCKSNLPPRDASSTDEQSNHDPVKAAPDSTPLETTVPIPVSEIPPPGRPSSPHRPNVYPPGSIAFILSQNNQKPSEEPESGSAFRKANEPAKGDGVNKRRMEGHSKGKVRHQALFTCRWLLIRRF